ncbi:MAG: hypothetical protein Q8R37_03575 [Nanoarchaeota archaeon]|nr:hypothetical protein [Nanoarchaeota archaeon]
MKLIFKGDADSIPTLEEAGFGPFELYVRNAQDLERNYHNIIALHFHYKLDDGRTINLADEGELGDKSEAMLRKAVECALRNKIKKVVFHPPYVDLTVVSKEKAIKTMVRRLERVHHPAVLLCIENVCLWISQAYTNEPLFVEPEDYFMILKEAKIPLGLTFDVEHFCATAVMKLFYFRYKDDIIAAAQNNNYPLLKDKFELELRSCTAKDLHNQCHSFLAEALEKLKPYINHVHVCGSDYANYFFNPLTTSPLIGEHLPIHFSGNSYGLDVKDRLDHKIWIEKLKDTNLDVVLEISPKEGYNFIDLLTKSKKNMEKML